jgi:hypothetical protein
MAEYYAQNIYGQTTNRSKDSIAIVNGILEASAFLFEGVQDAFDLVDLYIDD